MLNFLLVFSLSVEKPGIDGNSLIILDTRVFNIMECGVNMFF